MVEALDEQHLSHREMIKSLMFLDNVLVEGVTRCDMTRCDMTLKDGKISGKMVSSKMNFDRSTDRVGLEYSKALNSSYDGLP